jgi:hypothetical protein
MESWIEISEEWEEKIQNYLDILNHVIDETELELFQNRSRRQDWKEKHQNWLNQDITKTISD